MKFLLTLIICSGVANECRTVNGYPVLKPDYATCTLDGMIESHKFITKTFTYEQIENLRIVPKYTCTSAPGKEL